MIDIQIQIVKNTATPTLKAVREATLPENALPVLARSVSNTIRVHFDELDSSRPNKLGGRRTHWYSGARRSTSFVVDGDVAIIGIRQVGIRLRYYGGTVQPGVNTSSVTGKPTRYLTIPVTAESYGKRAGEFDDLVVFWGSRGPWALGRSSKGNIIHGTAGGTGTREVLFMLVQQATIQADPTLLPEGEAMSEAVRRDWASYIALVTRRTAA